jgi:PAS domain S-box-containing protein
MNIDSKTKEELVKELQDLQQKHNAILDLYKKEIIVDKLNNESPNTASKLSKDQTLELIQKLELEHDELLLLKEETRKFQFLSNEILVLLNSNLSLKKIIDAVLKLIQTEIKFSAIGICLKADNNLPYFSQIGFSENCFQNENSLGSEKNEDELLCKNKDGSIKLECTCSIAVFGKTNPGDSSLTKAGSYITNNSYPALELFTDKEPEFQPSNTCIHSKYGSVAIIPIMANEKIVGTLQLNHKETDAFTNEEIRFFEGICSNIGTALMRKQAEEIVKESEKKYRSLIKNMPDGVYKSTDEGKFVEVNLAMVKMLGYDSKEELMAIDIKTQLYFELSDRESIALQVEEKELGVYRMKKKDGSELWVEDHGWLNFDKTKNILFHEGILRDITGRIQAEEKVRESENKLQGMISGSPDLVWLKDQNGVYLECNARFEQYSGFSKANLIGKTDYDFFDRELADFFRENDRITIAAGKSIMQEEEFTFANDGHIEQVETIKTPLYDNKGQVLGVMGIGRDITERKQSEQALRESEERFKTIFGETPMGIALIDSITGYIYEANQMFAQIAGRTIEQITSIDWMTITHPEDIQEDLDNMALMNSEKISGFQMKKRYLKPDGTIVWVNMTVTPISISKGIHCKHLCMVEDITESRQAEDKLRNLSQAVEQSPITIVITDLDGIIEYVNPKFIETTGYSQEEVIGQNPRVLKSGHTSPEEYKQLWETVNNGGDWRGEFLNKRKNGELYWESASISPITNAKGETTHFIAIKEEITYRKETDLLLEEKNNKIEAQNEEYKRLNEELIIAKNHAEESDKLKTSFLANMSHEIRTPMNGILGFAGLLKDPMLTGDEQQEYIDIIEKSGARMLNIINDIIDISKIEAGLMKVKMSESNINDQIDYIYTFFKPEVEIKGMKLSCIKSLTSINSIIKTDREKVFAILINLVKNAVKYSNKGAIEFGYIKKEFNLEFFVSDTGIGIPKNRQKAVFERFIQADIDDKMAIQGAGLGLSISKAFVEMLGGKIWLESELGKGSTFYFTIPYNNKIDEKIGNKNLFLDNEIVNHLKKIKILIAEDDEISKLFINKVVQPFSKETLNVSNGAEAVAVCSNNPDIDLVLMDIKMPIMDGYEATEEIRKFNKEVIIIAQTANGLSSDIRKTIEVGCNDHISKPIDKHEFLMVLQKYFS